MMALRSWSVRHASGLARFYTWFERILLGLDPLLRRIGYHRLERPFAAVERTLKGLLFDCRMCGQCVLSTTGMSCPMNCPKQLRNGPCGGVGADGSCEVLPNRLCVWVAAWQGDQRLKEGEALFASFLPPVDRRLEGRSAWLGLLREKKAGHP